MNDSKAAIGAPEAPMPSGLRSRVSTKFAVLDRVLGGGLVKGSTTLLAGRPGTGKTTLTLQILDGLGQRCLYVTTEERLEDVAARAGRIGAMTNRIYVLSTESLEEILEHAKSLHVQAIAIDTIQQLRGVDINGRPGLPAQLRGCTARLIDYAGTTGTTLWFVGHLTAGGDVAGPITIVHSVDVVLRLDQEDDKHILSSSKNRFGSTNAVGRLRMASRSGHLRSCEMRRLFRQLAAVCMAPKCI